MTSQFPHRLLQTGDFCRLIVGNPQPVLSVVLQVVIEDSLETITHSGFGPEVMTFAQIVVVVLFTRQVPYSVSTHDRMVTTCVQDRKSVKEGVSRIRN